MSEPIDVTQFIKLRPGRFQPAAQAQLDLLAAGGSGTFNPGDRIKIIMPTTMSIRAIKIKSNTGNPVTEPPRVRLSRDDSTYLPVAGGTRYPRDGHPAVYGGGDSSVDFAPMRHESVLSVNGDGGWEPDEWRFENLQDASSCIFAATMNDFDAAYITPDLHRFGELPVTTDPIAYTHKPMLATSFGGGLYGDAGGLDFVGGPYSTAAQNNVYRAFSLPPSLFQDIGGAVSFDISCVGDYEGVTWRPGVPFASAYGNTSISYSWTNPGLFGALKGWSSSGISNAPWHSYHPMVGPCATHTNAINDGEQNLLSWMNYNWSPGTQGPIVPSHVLTGASLTLYSHIYLRKNAYYPPRGFYTYDDIYAKKYETTDPPATSDDWHVPVVSEAVSGMPTGSGSVNGFWDFGEPATPILPRDNFYHVCISWVSDTLDLSWSEHDKRSGILEDNRARVMVNIVTPQWEWIQAFGTSNFAFTDPVALAIGDAAFWATDAPDGTCFVDNVKVFKNPKFYVGSFETAFTQLTCDFQYVEIEISPDEGGSVTIDDLLVSISDWSIGFSDRDLDKPQTSVDLNAEGVVTARGVDSDPYRSYVYNGHPLSSQEDVAITIEDTDGNTEKLIQISAHYWMNTGDMTIQWTPDFVDDRFADVPNNILGKVRSVIGPHGLYRGVDLTALDYVGGGTDSLFYKWMNFDGASWVTFDGIFFNEAEWTTTFQLHRTGMDVGSTEYLLFEIMDSVSLDWIRVSLYYDGSERHLRVTAHDESLATTVNYEPTESTDQDFTLSTAFIGIAFDGTDLKFYRDDGAGGALIQMGAGNTSAADLANLVFDSDTTRLRVGASLDDDTAPAIIADAGGIDNLRIYRFDASDEVSYPVTDYETGLTYSPIDQDRSSVMPDLTREFNWIGFAGLGTPLRFETAKDQTSPTDLDNGDVRGAWTLSIESDGAVTIDAEGDIYSDMCGLHKSNAQANAGLAWWYSDELPKDLVWCFELDLIVTDPEGWIFSMVPTYTWDFDSPLSTFDTADSLIVGASVNAAGNLVFSYWDGAASQHDDTGVAIDPAKKYRLRVQRLENPDHTPQDVVEVTLFTEGWNIIHQFQQAFVWGSVSMTFRTVVGDPYPVPYVTATMYINNVRMNCPVLSGLSMRGQAINGGWEESTAKGSVPFWVRTIVADGDPQAGLLQTRVRASGKLVSISGDT